MDDLTRAGYLAHARSPAFRRRLAEAEGVIASHTDFAVSVSWGKDSVVLLSVVAQVSPAAHVVFARYETVAEVLPDIDAVRDAVLSRREMAAIRYREVVVPGEWQAFERAGHAFVSPATPTEKAALKWWSESFQTAMRGALVEVGASGALIGMRGAESRARRITVAVRGLSYTRRDGRSIALPLARWSGADVWARVVDQGLPWLRIYDVAPDRERARSDFTWAAGGDGITRYGAAAVWRAAYPEAVDAWLAKWPELQAMAHL